MSGDGDSRPSHPWQVVIRADGGTAAGFGHLMRTSSLARGLVARGAEVRFIGRLDHSALRILREGGFEAKSFDSTACDVEEMNSFLSREARCDVLIVDDYSIREPWFSDLDPRPSVVMCIDDKHDRVLGCDILLDQNWIDETDPYAALVPEGCRTLLGPKYGLLRPEFRNAHAREPKVRGRVRRILVSFGASDPTDETSKVLRGFELSKSEFELRVLPGPANTKALELARLYAKVPGVTFLGHVDDMAAELANADLAIGAAGSTTWERCCLGVPGVLVQTADNQEDIARAAQSLGFASVLGTHQGTNSEVWRRFFETDIHDEERWSRQSRAGRALVDGAGVDRVASELVNLFESKRKGAS